MTSLPIWIQSLPIILPLSWLLWHSTQDGSLRYVRGRIFGASIVMHSAIGLVIAFFFTLILEHINPNARLVAVNATVLILGLGIQTISFLYLAKGRKYENGFTVYFTNLLAISWTWCVLANAILT